MSEILAPCGGMESLIAAVNSGADAVYLGEEHFSARRNAENFNENTLKEAVKLCHYSGVKVYVTLNTLIFDKEMSELAKAIEACARAEIDAFIIQDLGVVRLVKDMVPEVPVHASTQMTVNSLYGAIAAEKLGFSRVVLGRELSFEQIKYITQNCNIETEIFVHGALCVCVSGQCYMSSVLGGRSGNRGLCAQPCRLDFTYGDRHNILSLKDISLIKHLKELENIGVNSFKIEGRMKRPEYVAGAVDACRKALANKEFDIDTLGKVFSRSGFTDGYYTDSFKNMQGIRTKEDVVSAPRALNAMKQIYHRPFVRHIVDINAEILKGKSVKLTAKSGTVNAEITGDIPEIAVNKTMTTDYVKSQLSKLGGTVYRAGDVNVTLDEGLIISASGLNELRRRLIAHLSENMLIKNSHNYRINPYREFTSDIRKNPRMAYRCEVSNQQQLKEALSEDDYEFIYAPYDLLSENTPDKFRIIALPPVFLADCENEVKKKLLWLKESGYTHIGSYTVGHTLLIKELGLIPHGTIRQNITNSISASEHIKTGLQDISLSPELLMQDAIDIAKKTPAKCGIIAYGRLPLMLTRRCPINDGKPCGKNKRKDCKGFIKDRQGNNIPVICGINTVEILNPDVLVLSDRQRDINSFDFVILKFTYEKNTGEILRMYKNDIKSEGKLTRGLYYRGVQ